MLFLISIRDRFKKKISDIYHLGFWPPPLKSDNHASKSLASQQNVLHFVSYSLKSKWWLISLTCKGRDEMLLGKTIKQSEDFFVSNDQSLAREKSTLTLRDILHGLGCCVLTLDVCHIENIWSVIYLSTKLNDFVYNKTEGYPNLTMIDGWTFDWTAINAKLSCLAE